MARKARKEVFLPEEVNVYHCFNRTVRRSFLHGIDPLTKADYSHRRDWFVAKIRALANCFCIDVLAFAVMSNHWHCVLRNRPDLVRKMSNREVAIRWLSKSQRKKTAQNPHGRPSDAEINALVNDSKKIAEARVKLSDISWFIRLMCQTVARKCNREDRCTGHFFEERFKMSRLDDEADVLACMAYVDLNPIKAEVADSLDDPDWQTSIGERLRTVDDAQQAVDSSTWLAPLELSTEGAGKTVVVANDLSPQELTDHLQAKETQRLGCLPMKLSAYEQLLWHLALELRPELQALPSLTARKVGGRPTLRGQTIDMNRLQETLARLQNRCSAALGRPPCDAIGSRLSALPPQVATDSVTSTVAPG